MKPPIKTRLTDFEHQDEFDLKYWQELGPEAIMHAAAQMTEEVYRFKRIPPHERIFQRTIVHLQRAGS